MDSTQREFDSDRASKRRRLSPGTATDESPTTFVSVAHETGVDGINSKSEGLSAQGPQPKKKGKEKNKGRRDRRATSYHKGEETGESSRGDSDAPIGPKMPRLPKRQCALLIGFCGSGYSGMQIQPPPLKTIEGTLFQALVATGAVSQDNADDPVKVALARAARTDAGVHAAGNIVSIKMIMNIPGVPDLVSRVNELLPPEIRLWGYARVQNSFNARIACDSRKYTYYFPSYLLIPPKPGSNQHRVLSQHAESLGHTSALSHSFWDDLQPSREIDMQRKRAWRVGQDQIEKLRAAAQRFVGTHNFHNFTVGRDVSDKSNQRHIKSVEIADPVTYGETEWVSVLFHGQSFMLHQRKMMSSLVLSARTGTLDSIITELYKNPDVFIPKMPSLGLLLEEPIFASYNNRMNTVNKSLKPNSPDYRPAIDFEPYKKQIEDFKNQFIYKNMREIEDRDGLFDAWIRMVDNYAGNDLLYLNPEGTVPDAAVIKKGERREHPFRERRVFDATSFSESDNIKTKLQQAEEGVVEEDDEEAELDKKQLADTEG
ncbi:pseudouridine synthase [Macrolepiota fuliginosa MF-IS2]|uniref:Pseudouridine synthase n=1 Tax=Macrolepiota fuliginosa MF-IS2 TaxID=1400762 RepID=A0A9P5XR85_9AGAR|nr:pseudouridine synthase [Macrolepiota fuliginosa MF-IS2]